MCVVKGSESRPRLGLNSCEMAKLPYANDGCNIAMNLLKKTTISKRIDNYNCHFIELILFLEF